MFEKNVWTFEHLNIKNARMINRSDDVKRNFAAYLNT